MLTRLGQNTGFRSFKAELAGVRCEADTESNVTYLELQRI